MKIISLLNEKGGSSKTTVATTIASGLAVRGQRVLLIDADPQGHGTIMLGLEKEPCIYDLLVRDALWSKTLRQVSDDQFTPRGQKPLGTLVALPSNVETRNIANSISDSGLLRYRLDELQDVIDVVIIDTSPTPSLFHGSIYLAADAVIYPTQAEYLSVDGLIESLKHLDKANVTRLNERGLEALKIAGIQPTMVDPKTVTHSEYLKLLTHEFKRLVWPPLPSRIVWADASAARQSIFRYVDEDVDPDSIDAGYQRSKGEAGSALREAWALVKRVERVLNG